jgi:apolipoprotein N-acyltransferase
MFAGAWLLAELARGVIFTGFPWVASGYAHVDSPFGGFAPWVGVYGLGAIAAGVAAAFGFSRLGAARAWLAPWCCWRDAGARRRRRPHRLHPAGGSLSVSLLQGNVPQEEKFAMRYVRQALASTWRSS